MSYQNRQTYPDWKQQEAVRMWRIAQSNGHLVSKAEIGRYLRVNENTVRMWINENPEKQPVSRKPESIFHKAKQYVGFGRMEANGSEG